MALTVLVTLPYLSHEIVMKTAWILGLALLFSAPAWAQEASFDCAQATAPDEVTICDSAELSTLEAAGADAFAQVSQDHAAAAKAIDRPALKARHDCGADAACIADVLMQALYSYWAAGAVSEQAQDMDSLIFEWEQANETCRGSSDPDAGAEACGQRNLLTLDLHAIGLCEGAYTLDDTNSPTATLLREHWVPCYYPELQN